MPTEPFSLPVAMAELETIENAFQSNEVSLEESLVLYEKAKTLVAAITTYLKTTEQVLEKIDQTIYEK